ncbi:transposable element P transposase [Trichonephila clavipes]|uniref:Transposable element P transposase n=1 Tax=Trichonephila clavipes TaxID=2585209 RepID=A0A8X6RQ44_TRICX|nr:transposable element P transposase [Trichonephila clavipes]
MAYNSEQAATSAYVFMIQSLLSPLKVVHIMPVKEIDGEKLFAVVKKTLVELDGIGFKVIGVVSDNNSINRKAMSNFSVPPKLSFVYPHPSDSSNPLFFVIDSVHLFKCICNNWINQKNAGQCFYFPDFEDHNKFPLLEANFSKFASGLTLKALCPTNLEKQNTKLVLKIFYNYVIQGLQLLGEQHKLISYETTSICISLISTWWKIVNVKTPLKGQHLLDPYQQPITLSPDNQTCEFLHKILSCIFFPGKIQTDALESRFGKYKTLSGSQYLISIRQLYEVEAKLRIQNFLPLTLVSNTYGQLNLKEIHLEHSCNENPLESSVLHNLNITLSEKDFHDAQPYLTVLTYLAGVCARAALKKLKCDFCSKSLVLKKSFELNSNYDLIRNLDRGSLLCPSPAVVTAVLYNYKIVQKLLSNDYENMFLKQNNQR